jgi:hypothetical protein
MIMIELKIVLLSRVMNEKKAVFSRYDFGPSFCDDDLGIWCKKSTYTKPIIVTKDYFFVK